MALGLKILELTNIKHKIRLLTAQNFKTLYIFKE